METNNHLSLSQDFFEYKPIKWQLDSRKKVSDLRKDKDRPFWLLSLYYDKSKDSEVWHIWDILYENQRYLKESWINEDNRKQIANFFRDWINQLKSKEDITRHSDMYVEINWIKHYIDGQLLKWDWNFGIWSQWPRYMFLSNSRDKGTVMGTVNPDALELFEKFGLIGEKTERSGQTFRDMRDAFIVEFNKEDHWIFGTTVDRLIKNTSDDIKNTF